MKRYSLLFCLVCLFAHLGFAQDKEVKEAMKQINSIKADSKYLYAESTTKDWDQAYEDAKSLLLVEIDNWVKSQGKKNEENSHCTVCCSFLLQQHGSGSDL